LNAQIEILPVVVMTANAFFRYIYGMDVYRVRPIHARRFFQILEKYRMENIEGWVYEEIF